MNPRRTRLAQRLRDVRAAAYPSGNQFATAIGWIQSRVSKIETGNQLPTEDDIRAWATAAHADDATDELLGLLADARVEYANARDIRRRAGLGAYQAELAALETQAKVIAEYQPSIIPGSVQTTAYARQLLHLPGGPLAHGASEAEIDAIVAGRIQRQQVLYERRVRLVITEAALRSVPATQDTLRGQLDRLITIDSLPTVDIAILPLGVMPVLPLSGFILHDDLLVLIETLTGLQRLDDPHEVAVYVDAFERLVSGAAVKEDAAAIIRQAMQHL